MNNNRIPDNEELARRIAMAFDALPGPDEERLEAIWARLETQFKRPSSRSYGKSWIWLLLLAGGAATAAWWANDAIRQESKVPLKRQPVTETQMDEITGNNGTGDGVTERKDASSKKHQDSRVIYQREEF